VRRTRDATPAEAPGRRLGPGRLVAFAAVVLLGALVLGELAASAHLRREQHAGITRADFFLFVRQPVVARRGDRIEVTEYGSINSAQDSVPADADWLAVLLGGSFAAGDPWVTPRSPREVGGMAGFLEGRVGGEVLSLAGNGDTSIRVREKLPQLLALQPDLLIVASGNNEFPLDPPRWQHLLRRSELARLLRSSLPLRGLEPPDDLDALRLNGPPRATLRRTFEGNLATIRRRAATADVPLLLATLPNNLLIDLASPQAFDSPDAACAATLQQAPSDSPARRWLDGVAAGTGGCLAELVARYAADPDDALDAAADCPELAAAGAAGLALLFEGRPEARAVLEFRVETDTRGVRPSFNRAVRAAGATVVDLNAAAAALDPDGVPGPGLFVDCCHLDWAGYAELAERLAEATGRPRTGPHPREQGAPALPPPYPTEPRSRPAPGACPAVIPR
jgi:hypothetical protein